MLAKYYTFAGVLRMLAKYYTFAGVLRMLAKYYTFTGGHFIKRFVSVFSLTTVISY